MICDKVEHGFMDKTKFKRNLKRISTAIVVLYIGCYIVLSALGQYDNRLDASGKTKYTFGLSVPDVYVWQPKCLMLRSNNWNYGGLFYSSLILIDRMIWHKNLPA